MRAQLRFTIAKLLDMRLDLNDHEHLLDQLLEDLPQQPHSNPAWAKLNQKEYFYKHHSHLKSAHTSSSSKEAVCTAVVTKTAFQEIQDGAATARHAPVKVEHVAHGKLKLALKTCKTALRAVDAAASDARKMSAALKAKAQKSGDCEAAAAHAKRAAEVDLASANLLTFNDALLTFVAESDLLDDATSDDALADQTADAEAYCKKADEHLDCFKRIKATIKL